MNTGMETWFVCLSLTSLLTTKVILRHCPIEVRVPKTAFLQCCHTGMPHHPTQSHYTQRDDQSLCIPGH